MKERTVFYPGREIHVGMRGVLVDAGERSGEAFEIVRDYEADEWRMTWWAQFTDRHEELLCFPHEMKRAWFAKVFGEEALRRADARPEYTYQER